MKKPFFGNLFSKLSQAFFPEGIKCVSCGDELSKDMKYCLCHRCLPEFAFLGGEICGKCGVRMENAAPFCQTCKNNVRQFDLARGVLFYSEKAARLIKDFKSGDKFLAPYLADMMYDYCLENLRGNIPAPHCGKDAPEAEKNGGALSSPVGAVCFVPSGPRRMKERGYDQAAVLAKLFCEKAGLPLYDALCEVRPTRRQSLLKSVQRRENVKGAYGVRESFPAKDLKDKHIMLIDDIFTTGSTAGECAAVLKKAGAKEVFVFTLATGKGL